MWYYWVVNNSLKTTPYFTRDIKKGKIMTVLLIYINFGDRFTPKILKFIIYPFILFIFSNTPHGPHSIFITFLSFAFTFAFQMAQHLHYLPFYFSFSKLYNLFSLSIYYHKMILYLLIFLRQFLRFWNAKLNIWIAFSINYFPRCLTHKS